MPPAASATSPPRARRPSAQQRIARAGRALSAGLALGRTRLFARPVALLVLLSLGAALTIALLERNHGPVGAADRALAVVFRWVVPLASFALVGLATGKRRLGESVWCVARFGVARDATALGLVVAAAVAAGLLALLTVELTVVVAHPFRGPLVADLWPSGWIAALGAAAYVAWFSLGAALLRHGRGRWVPFVLDFLLGEGTGPLAVVWPSAHVRNLIGGTAPLDLPQSSSSVVLMAMALLLALLAALRCGD